MIIKEENIIFKNISDPLARLSKEELVILINLYYLGIKAPQLKKLFSINDPSTLPSLFPLWNVKFCSECGMKKIIKFPTLGKFKTIIPGNIYCSNCGHTELDSCICSSSNCHARREESKREQRLQIEKERLRIENERMYKKAMARQAAEIKQREFYEDKKILCSPEHYQKFRMDKLTLNVAYYLLMVLEMERVEKGKQQTPWSLNRVNKKWEKEMLMEMKRMLVGKGLLVPTIDSKDENFRYAKTFTSQFPWRPTSKTRKLQYQYAEDDELWINVILDEQNLGNSFIFPNHLKGVTSEEKEFFFELWQEIACYEVRECCRILMMKLGYRLGTIMQARESSKSTILNAYKRLLQDYSINEVRVLIAAAIEEYEILILAKKTSANYYFEEDLIGICERLGSKAILEIKTDLEDFQESKLAGLVFDEILGIGELGYEVPPTSAI